MSDKEKPRLARLTAMLTQLQTKRLLTAWELAEKHDISIRTVYRDINTLKKSGVPISTEEGKGYTLMQGYNLPPVMFTEEEANALITAEQLMLKNKDQSLLDSYSKAILKIKSVLNYSQKDKIELLAERIQFRNNVENEQTSSYLMVIQSALTNFNVLRLEYLSMNGQLTNRNVEPFALYSTQDNWLMVAHCCLRDEFRVFRLDHIQKLQTLDTKFAPHPLTLQEYFDECRKKYANPADTPDTPLT